MKALQKLAGAQTIPVININGVIDAKQTLKVTNAIKRINTGTAKAVALVVNSPGGSPVQGDIISQKVKSFCKQNKLPLYTFAEDVAASGGFQLLCIGDKVYVDNNSLVGSVGVIASWMAYKPFLQKHNIETRQFSTQDHLLENLFDPVNSSKPQGQTLEYIQKAINGTHQLFINHVEQHRGDKITLSSEERQKQIYNAEVFSGEKAVSLGLADQIGSYQQVLFSEFPKATLDFVVKRSFKEKMCEKGVLLNINLPGFKQGQSVQESMNQQMTNEFLKSFK